MELHSPFPHFESPYVKQTSLHAILIHASDFLPSPFYSGLISMAVRNLHWEDQTQIIMELEATISKELQAAKDIYRPVTLDFSSILSHDPKHRKTHSLLPNYNPSPQTNNYCYHQFMSSRSTLTRLRIFPQCSTKTLGSRTKTDIHLMNLALDSDYAPTTAGLERLEHDRNIRLEGDTEVRSAFKYNDLRPRVYYARGPDAHYGSRYIQPIFNTLVDAFPVTHRFERFLSTSIDISPTAELFIYDYSAFTSTLNILRDFVSELAEHFGDFTINVYDHSRGFQPVSLREELHRHNSICNVDPSFYVGNVFHEKLWSGSSSVDNHNTGMLGVPGNITASTLLHGLHLIAVLMSIDVKCVGDDAIGTFEFQDREALVGLLSNIGICSLPKMEFWDRDSEESDLDRTWHYVKRPITRVLDRMITSTVQFNWPPLGAIDPRFGDDLHTSRYPDTIPERQMRCLKYIKAFLLQFQHISTSDEEKEFADHFVRVLLLFMDIEKGTGGSLGPLPRHPTYDDILSNRVPVLRVQHVLQPESIMAALSGKSVRLPRIGRTYPDPWELQNGWLVEGNMSAAVSFARKLGLVQVESVSELVLADDHEEEIMNLVFNRRFPEPAIYRFQLSDEIRPVLKDLIMQSQCAPPDQLSYIDDSIYQYDSDISEDSVDDL